MSLTPKDTNNASTQLASLVGGTIVLDIEYVGLVTAGSINIGFVGKP